MAINQLHEEYQSAYRPHHSTETALLKVQGDILEAMDQKEGVLMVLLDLTAAFDTVSHPKLIATLDRRFGLKGTALQWVSSYLADRTQTVCIDELRSPTTPLSCGVPQGSVLGPVLFTLYTAPLGDIIRSHGISTHMYADDTQLYVTFDPSEDPAAVCARMRDCIEDLKRWMKRQCLKLNDSKTEVICFAAPQSPIDPAAFTVQVGDSLVTPSHSVRNLGVMLDQRMQMGDFITKTCQACFLQLRDISAIRGSLTDSAAAQIVHALVTSRMDYCNSMLTGCKQQHLAKLQRVQNLASRVVLGQRWRLFDCSKLRLQHLHWLPVAERISYKILLLTFKRLQDTAPHYLEVERYVPPRELRTEGAGLLAVPRSRPRTALGHRTFKETACKLWNSIPSDECRAAQTTDAFKHRLKTELFTRVFIMQ